MVELDIGGLFLWTGMATGECNLLGYSVDCGPAQAAAVSDDKKRAYRRYSDDEKAAALADVLLLGPGATAAKYAIPLGTLKTWQQEYHVAFDLKGKSERIKALAIATVSAPSNWQIPIGSAFTEKQLSSAAFGQIDRIARHYNWPVIIGKRAEYRLPDRTIIDMLLHHVDGSITIIELKSSGGSVAKSRGWLLYQCIGQLLYYAEVISEFSLAARDSVRLCVMTDFAPNDAFLRSLQRTDPVIQHINVLPLLR